jgi:hypothetical protein
MDGLTNATRTILLPQLSAELKMLSLTVDKYISTVHLPQHRHHMPTLRYKLDLNDHKNMLLCHKKLQV